MAFVRLRKFRRSPAIRDLFSETKLSVSDFILPYFVIEGRNKKEAIDLFPGIYRLSIDNLIKDINETKSLGIKSILIFGASKKKDARGSSAYNNGGIVQMAVREIKKNIKDITIITDVCLCGYTTCGHCGIVKGESIDNDATLNLLAKIALSHARAGADFVA